MFSSVLYAPIQLYTTPNNRSSMFSGVLCVPCQSCSIPSNQPFPHILSCSLVFSVLLGPLFFTHQPFLHVLCAPCQPCSTPNNRSSKFSSVPSCSLCSLSVLFYTQPFLRVLQCSLVFSVLLAGPVLQATTVLLPGRRTSLRTVISERDSPPTIRVLAIENTRVFFCSGH